MECQTAMEEVRKSLIISNNLETESKIATYAITLAMEKTVRKMSQQHLLQPLDSF